MRTTIIVIVALFAQAPSGPTSPRASVSGIVLGVGDQPVAGATVSAFWDPPPFRYSPADVPRAVTEADGRFRIQNLSSGGYRISVTAPGYVTQQYGSSVPGLSRAATVVTVGPDQPVADIIVRLTPDSIISGRITTTDGQPMVRMEVVALIRRFDSNGWPSLARAGSAETNDRGEYRISGLSPETHYIRAAPVYSGLVRAETLRAGFQGTAAPILPTPGVYATVYYPGVASTSQATTVRVQQGVETFNINIVLPRLRPYSIRGRVVDGSGGGGLPAGKPLIGARPAHVEYLSGFGASVEPYQPDGTFVLTGVAPGLYWVTAQLPGPPSTPEIRQLLQTPGADVSQLPRPARGVALVNIVDADVDNVVLSIVRDLEITGFLRVEGEALSSPEGFRDIKLDLRPADSASNGGPVGFTVTGSTSTISYRGLMPTEYRLTVSALPSDLYVKEARFGRFDLLRESFLLTAPSKDTLDIVLARGGEVTGTVIDGRSMAVPNQTVVLVPNDRFRLDLYKTATTGAVGRFTFQGVAPGDYKAFSWQTMDQFQYFDEKLVGASEEKGSPVRSDGTGRANVDVVLIP